MHSPNFSVFAFFSPFAYLYRVRSGKKDSKKVKLLLLQTSSKTVAFFYLKFSEYTNVQMVRVLFTLSIT